MSETNDAHLLNMGKPLPPVPGQPDQAGLPMKRKSKKSKRSRTAGGPPSERNKWDADQLSTLSTAIMKHGTNFKAIVEDEEFKQKIGPNRTPSSLQRAYHKYIPAGQLEKKQLREARETKKITAAAAGQHLSDTSSDDDSGSDSDSDSGSDSDSDSGSSGSSSEDEGQMTHHSVINPGAHHQMQQHHPHPHHNPHHQMMNSHVNNPQHIRNKPRVGPGGVLEDSQVPIEAWEKPANDKRDDSFFCRCRHICGCRSTSAEGRPWANGQAVMVRGSRRNHETNQKLHPDCSKNSACWALLHSLKDARQSKGQLQARRSIGDSDNEDDRHGKKRKRSHESLPSLIKKQDEYDEQSNNQSGGDQTVPVSHALFQEMLEQCQVLNMTIRSVHATSPLLTANVSDLATALVQANARIAEQQAQIEQLSDQVQALNNALSQSHQPPPPPQFYVPPPPPNHPMNAPPGGMNSLPPNYVPPPPPPMVPMAQ